MESLNKSKLETIKKYEGKKVYIIYPELPYKYNIALSIFNSLSYFYDEKSDLLTIADDDPENENTIEIYLSDFDTIKKDFDGFYSRFMWESYIIKEATLENRNWITDIIDPLSKN